MGITKRHGEMSVERETVFKPLNIIFYDNVTVTLIGQVRKDHLEIEQKREILQNMEIFWQKTLNTVKANALTRQWIYVFAVVQFYP